MPKNLLFITWDGPQTSYMEGLFLPIFQEIAKSGKYRFHVIQFTWANSEKTIATKRTAQEMGIQYTAFPVYRKPLAAIGSLITLFTSSKKLKKYIRENKIDIVMPRSTFPAMIINRLKVTFRGFKGKIIFDADGLPLEERVDFGALKKTSRQYLWQKGAETKMLQNADAVITRSQKSIDIHLENIGEKFRKKFSVVFNGRDSERFTLNENNRKTARKELNCKEDELLFVYCGSLGTQYCWDEMREIFENYSQTNPAKFLILTGNIDFAQEKLSSKNSDKIILKSVPFSEIPFWLQAGDLAFALRKPSFSMQGVAPIKLGEYLLCGIPTIASKGIGDTEEILKNFKECFLYDHQIEHQEKEISDFIEKTKFADRKEIRNKAIPCFSLEAAADSYLAALNKLNE